MSKCRCLLTVTMATDMSAFGGCQPADRLRLASSKGQMDKVKELVLAGTSFQPDKVSVFCK